MKTSEQEGGDVKPEKDGLAMISELKEKGSQVPIGIISSTSLPEPIDKAKKLGVKFWIVKPFKFPDLLQAIEKSLG